MAIGQQTVAGTVRAGILDGALRPRLVGFAEGLRGPSWFASLLEAGSVRFSDEDFAETGPVLSWRPWSRDTRATFKAGTSGIYLIIGPTALANAVGHIPESRELREFADRTISAPLPGSGASFTAIRAAFQGVSRELALDQVAAHAIVEAYLKVILVEVYRAGLVHHSGAERSDPSLGVFARYSALVEAHFRDRWSVNDYARVLGVSRDRLGDICRRVRGLGPKDLIDRRISLEARLQLENSSLSIQQVAGLLGFASSAQFNRFFHRTTGKPPGIYRKTFVAGMDSGGIDPARPYDWP